MIHARTIDNAGNKSDDKTANAWKDATPPPKVDLSFNAKTENSVTVTTKRRRGRYEIGRAHV